MDDYQEQMPSHTLKKKKRREVDPFVVFTAEMRPTVTQSNPGCSSSEITAILGAIWRNMSPMDKRKYQLISQSLDNFECKPRKPSPIHPMSIKPDSSNDNDIRKRTHDTVFPIPNIFVVPRGDSGIEASKASEELIRKS